MEDRKKCVLGAASKAGKDDENVSGRGSTLRKRFMMKRKGEGIRLLREEGLRLLGVV